MVSLEAIGIEGEQASHNREAEKANPSQLIDSYADGARRSAHELGRKLQKYYSAQEDQSSLLEDAASAQREFKYGPRIRDLLIQKHKHLSSTRDICAILDKNLAFGDTTIGLSPAWILKYGVLTFVEAYDNIKLKPLVQKMIANAKKRRIRFP